MAALALQGIRVVYGRVPVVRGVDFEVGSGAIHGLIGHNFCAGNKCNG